MIETVTPGPAGGASAPPAPALPRVAKIPAPMIAPMPRATRSMTFSVFLRPCASSSPSAIKASSGFRRKRDMGAFSLAVSNCPARIRGGWGFCKRGARAPRSARSVEVREQPPHPGGLDRVRPGEVGGRVPPHEGRVVGIVAFAPGRRARVDHLDPRLVRARPHGVTDAERPPGLARRPPLLQRRGALGDE